MKKVFYIFAVLLSLVVLVLVVFVSVIVFTTHSNWKQREQDAINGNASDQFLIGNGYENGYEQPRSLGYFSKDLNKAASWYKKSCDNGYSKACIRLKILEKH